MTLLEGWEDESMNKMGYWFRASAYHCFIIHVDIKENNVIAKALEVDTSQTDCGNLSEIKNGSIVNFMFCADVEDYWLKLDLWGKYYFPEFNNDKNQWYHKHYEGDNNYIEDFTKVLKATYDIAMKESGLHIY